VAPPTHPRSRPPSHQRRAGMHQSIPCTHTRPFSLPTTTPTLLPLACTQPGCPLCAPEHRKTADLRRSQAASAADRDSFFKQLRAAQDGFAVVAEYFGKGLLNNTSVSTTVAATLVGEGGETIR
jgi:hypothetical protein